MDTSFSLAPESATILPVLPPVLPKLGPFFSGNNMKPSSNPLSQDQNAAANFDMNKIFQTFGELKTKTALFADSLPNIFTEATTDTNE